MSNPEIIKYVKQQLSAGYSKEKIIKVLLSSGWKKEDIDNAFIEAEGGVYELNQTEGITDLRINNSLEAADKEVVEKETISEITEPKANLTPVFSISDSNCRSYFVWGYSD
ncbi:MAG: hypothetical protein H6779_03670 [Candidatus Nomurabacteria bacterium]|nr:hypothetical protein [Candidatus Nomurabacteria bacterium]USN87486.1 MAG: hypothetical protein H6779_03670 [Candidatus Nomurabacteria bacterium]